MLTNPSSNIRIQKCTHAQLSLDFCNTLAKHYIDVCMQEHIHSSSYPCAKTYYTLHIILIAATSQNIIGCAMTNQSGTISTAMLKGATSPTSFRIMKKKDLNQTANPEPSPGGLLKPRGECPWKTHVCLDLHCVALSTVKRVICEHQ